jgi:hypothetical protein
VIAVMFSSYFDLIFEIYSRLKYNRFQDYKYLLKSKLQLDMSQNTKTKTKLKCLRAATAENVTSDTIILQRQQENRVVSVYSDG